MLSTLINIHPITMFSIDLSVHKTVNVIAIVDNNLKFKLFFLIAPYGRKDFKMLCFVKFHVFRLYIFEFLRISKFDGPPTDSNEMFTIV